MSLKKIFKLMLTGNPDADEFEYRAGKWKITIIIVVSVITSFLTKLYLYYHN